MQWIWLGLGLLGLVMILFFNRQLRSLLEILRNLCLGGLGLWLGNMLFAPMGTAVGINLVTVFAAAVLGLPGIVLLYVTQWMLG